MSPDGLEARLCVRVTPRSRRDEVRLASDGTLLVRLKAPPVEGAANRALVALLADRLSVAKSDVAVLRGKGSRDKLVAVAGVGRAEALDRLRGL